MPWSSILGLARNPGKQSRAKLEYDLPRSPSETSQQSDLMPSNLRVIPPEIWLQILDFVPLEILWFLRPTCRLFNKLAIARAWQTIRGTEVGVRTFFDSEHEPLSYLSSTAELLHPSLPQSISLDIRGKIFDDPVFINTTVATWRVSTEHPSDCEELRMSYRPLIVEIHFGAYTAGYSIDRPQPTYGRLEDFTRKEIWASGLSTKSRSTKFAKLFSSKSSRRTQFPWPIYKGLTPRWSIKYMAKYGYGRNDDGQVVSQLVNLTLLEVSLPVVQVVCTLIDALKYGAPVGQEVLND